MADKKFGKKRVCENCEIKFYDLNKVMPLICPQCKKEIVIEDNVIFAQSTQSAKPKPKSTTKDEFSEIENTDDADTDTEDEIISLDDAAIEEEEGEK